MAASLASTASPSGSTSKASTVSRPMAADVGLVRRRTRCQVKATNRPRGRLGDGPEERLCKLPGVERAKIVGPFSDPHVADRNPDLLADRDGDATARGPVELREDD